MGKNENKASLSIEQFEKLFKLHFEPLCHFANGIINDPEASKDICQKVFIVLWEKRQSIDPDQNVKSYLFTSVKNKSLNFLRDHKKFRSSFLDLECLDIPADDAHDSETRKNELIQEIKKSISNLPEKCRKVFEMSRFDGKKYKEIAEELGISIKTVEAHMSRAMKELRELLKDYRYLILMIFLNI